MPIHKKKSRYEFKNFSIITLMAWPLSAVSIERILALQVMAYHDDFGLNSFSQFGYKSERLSKDQLIRINSEVSTWIDNSCIVDFSQLNYSNALKVVFLSCCWRNHGIWSV